MSDDDVVSERAYPCSPEVCADLDATLAGQTLRQRGALQWFDVKQRLRSGRVRWVTRGTWPGPAEAARCAPGSSSPVGSEV